MKGEILGFYSEKEKWEGLGLNEWRGVIRRLKRVNGVRAVRTLDVACDDW